YRVVEICGCFVWFFFFQAEDGIRDFHVTGVQTCALPISTTRRTRRAAEPADRARRLRPGVRGRAGPAPASPAAARPQTRQCVAEIGRASCRERVEASGGGGGVRGTKRGLENKTRRSHGE